MIAYIIWDFTVPIYLVYKIVMIWVYPEKIWRQVKLLPTQITLTLTATAAIVIRLLLMIYAVLVLRGFGKGLKEGL